MTQLTYDLARALAKGGARATRSWSPGSTTTRTSGRGCRPPRPLGATRALGRLRPGHRRADRRRRGRAAVRAHPAGRGHRRLQPARHPARPRRPSPTAVHAAGALLFVDGVHLTPHAPVDVADLGADFYACSPYKFFGPHLGVLAADPALLEQLHPDKLLPSTDAVPGAVRARHAALRAARRRHRGGRLHRRRWPAVRGHRRDRVLESMRGRGGARGRAVRAAARRPRRASTGCAATAARRGARRRCCSRSRGAPAREVHEHLAGTRRERPGRAASTPSRPPAGSASATPARCGPGWRRTPRPTTSTGCSPGVAELAAMSRARAGHRGVAGHRRGGRRGRSPTRATGSPCTTAGRATPAEEVLAGLPGEGHLLVQADLADPDAVRRTVDEAAAGLGGLDVLVNNAGVFLAHPPLATVVRRVAGELGADAGDQPDRRGERDVLRGAAPGRARRRCGGQRVQPRRVPRRAGLPGLRRVEGRPERLRPVDGAWRSRRRASPSAPWRPGSCETDMAREVLDGPRGDEVRAQSPFGRVARPEEVAAAVLWLASPGGPVRHRHDHRRERRVVPAQLEPDQPGDGEHQLAGLVGRGAGRPRR